MDPEILRWETLTKKQFDAIDRERVIVMVTCSPLEVHGPHLPLGADALEGEGLSERTLRFLPDEHKRRSFLKLPFVYAATDTVPQPGSLHFRPSTTMAVLEDLGRSLAGQGFKNVVVSNFHGSPRHFLAIESACHKVSAERDIKMVPIFSLMMSRLNGGGSELGEVLGHLPGVDKEDFDGDTHGGLVETSQLLALHPDWVDPDYKGLPHRTVDLWLEERGESRPRVKPSGLAALPEMVRDFKASLAFFREESYSGRPAKASAELGHKILDLLAERTAGALTEILEDRLPRNEWHSPVWKLRHLFVNRTAVALFDRILDAPRDIR